MASENSQCQAYPALAFRQPLAMLRLPNPGLYGNRKMAEEYPSDLDGDVLRMIAEDGNDMTVPMEVDFHVALATEEAAEKVAVAATSIGYETFVDFDDGSDGEEELEDEVTEPWTCTCRKTMLLKYDDVMAAQAELDEIARPLGGYADGWGTFGNVERPDEEEDFEDEEEIDDEE